PNSVDGNFQRAVLVVLLAAGHTAVDLPDAVPPDGLDGHVVGAGLGLAGSAVDAGPMPGHVQRHGVVAVGQPRRGEGHIRDIAVVLYGVIGAHGDVPFPALGVVLAGEA